MLNLPFVRNTFDGIWFSQAFEYIPPDFRRNFLHQLSGILKPGGILFASIETWQYPSISVTIKEFLGDLKYYLFWRIVKAKPLRWGEFLYPLSIKHRKVWHYYVHTSKKIILKLLKETGFEITKLKLGDGYIHILCRKH